jgi:hypothetical protein
MLHDADQIRRLRRAEPVPHGRRHHGLSIAASCVASTARGFSTPPPASAWADTRERPKMVRPAGPETPGPQADPRSHARNYGFFSTSVPSERARRSRFSLNTFTHGSPQVFITKEPTILFSITQHEREFLPSSNHSICLIGAAYTVLPNDS